MKRFIFTECYADKYFFGKLLQNEALLNKASGKDAVLKTVLLKRVDLFTIAIIDKDKTELDVILEENRELNTKKIEYKISIDNDIEILKISNHPIYIIQIGPIELEKWLVNFLNSIGKKIEDFGFEDLADFEENHCKKRTDKLLKDEKFKEVIKFIISNFGQTENSILKLKNVLTYLIEYNYNVKKDELINLLN